MITLEKWEQYFSGNMAHEEMHDLENQTLESKAESDAYDFLVENGIEKYKETILGINNSMRAQVSGHKGVKVIGFYPRLSWIAAEVIVGLSVGGYYLFQGNGNIDNTAATRQKTPTGEKAISVSFVPRQTSGNSDSIIAAAPNTTIGNKKKPLTASPSYQTH